jgi:hypothetical protein
MQLLGKIVKDLAEGDESRLAAFEALVLRVADGDDVSGMEAQPVLAAAGKSGTDLAAAVRRVERRRELARLMQAGEQAEADLADVRQLQDRANRELEAARQRHAEASARPRAGLAAFSLRVHRPRSSQRTWRPHRRAIS